MSNVIPFEKPIKTRMVKPEAACSFCKTPASKCKNLIWNQQEGADSKHICDKCLAKAKQRLEDKDD